MLTESTQELQDVFRVLASFENFLKDWKSSCLELVEFLLSIRLRVYVRKNLGSAVQFFVFASEAWLLRFIYIVLALLLTNTKMLEYFRFACAAIFTFPCPMWPFSIEDFSGKWICIFVGREIIENTTPRQISRERGSPHRQIDNA